MKDTLLIPEIPERETWEIESAREALRGSSPLHLGQSWLESIEPEFQSGAVQVGASGNRLVVLAEFEDKWIHNPATQKNEFAFTRGDTFEIFLKAERREDYWELHVTPDNVVLQLHLPRNLMVLSQEARSTGGSFEIESCFVWEAVFASKVQKQPDSWTVLAEIPLAIFGESDSHLILQANFARYDYLPGKGTPVLSATAALGQPLTFHDQRGWSLLWVCVPTRTLEKPDHIFTSQQPK